MGAKNKTKYSKIKPGNIFGSWVVVGEVFIDRYAKVPCRCRCGKESAVDAYTLTVGKSLSCITCFNSNKTTQNNSAWKGYKEIPASWFGRFRRSAKGEFEITIQDVWKLFEKQNRLCALSGKPISFVNEYTNGKKYTGLKCSASLDRIDSNKGYTVDNVQLVHKDVNIMKNAYNQNYFIELCKAIANNNL